MSPLWLVLALLPIIGSGERFNCRGRILGAYYADAKSGCKAFHVCVRVAGGGVRDFRFFCPPGTLFHQEAQTCTDWGDDDPLACPADIYDGQFDLYKIGSGYDTKKISSSSNREEESEFGLQRAETGDRRLAQNGQSHAPASDLRAAHSSDFFSGRREGGRDDSAPVSVSPTPAARQSFRRPTTRVSPPTTLAPPTFPSSPSTGPSHPTKYDVPSKRKLVRKRPVYAPTSPSPPSTFTQNYPVRPKQFFFEQEQQQQNFARRLVEDQPKFQTTNPAPQFNEEYVEVSRVTPKVNRHYSSTLSPISYSEQQSTIPQFTKKDGLTELYNYDAQSTSAFNKPKENRQFKATLRNSFNVSPSGLRDSDYVTPRKNVEINSNGDRRSSSTATYNGFSRNVGSTPDYRNLNSVSYEPEKNNFAQFSGVKQNFAYTPTVPPTTTVYTTTHVDAPLNLNTVAYKTNIGFDARTSNFADNGDDDGQYRPPQDEDDGQYRPELYERELLSGAHSLNIAASGNRLPDDQKPRSKPAHVKFVSQTAVPRPFSQPAPPSLPTQSPEHSFTTTIKPQTVSQSQRTFDYFQTYTTTSRPSDIPVQNVQNNNVKLVNTVTYRPTTTTTTVRPPSPEPRPFSTRAPAPAPALPPSSTRPASHPTHRPPAFSKPANKKEDNSYDYAYYDSDPGFSEYDQIEEFGKTKAKV